MTQNVNELRQSITRMVNALPRDQLQQIYDYTLATTQQLSREIGETVAAFDKVLKEVGR